MYIVFFRQCGEWFKSTKMFVDAKDAWVFAHTAVYEHHIAEAYRIEHESPKPLNMKAFMRDALALARMCPGEGERVSVAMDAAVRRFLNNYTSYPERFP